MPIYVFDCEKCETSYELMLGISEADDYPIGRPLDMSDQKLKCKCGSKKFKRVVTSHGKSPINWASWSQNK